MKTSNRILAMILSFFMLFSLVSEPSKAMATSLAQNEEGAIVKEDSSEGLPGKVVGKKKVFALDKTLLPSPKKTQSGIGLFRAPAANTEVTLVTKGLNDGNFDWTQFSNGNFKVWFEVNGTRIGQSAVTFTENGQMTQTVNVNWPENTTIETAAIVAEFDGNYDLRVEPQYSNSTGENGGLKFTLTAYEVPNTKVKVEYKDIYGNPLGNQYLPTTINQDVNVANQTPTFTLPLKNAEFNLRDGESLINAFGTDHAPYDLLEELKAEVLNALNGSMGVKINNNTSGQLTDGTAQNAKKYKYTIEQKLKKDPTVITLVYDADVAVPPKGDDGVTPVDLPTGYVRLTFDANEKVEPGKTGITGKHTAGTYAGQQKSYIDVKQGVKYDNTNLQNAIKALSTTGTKEVNGETKTYSQETKTPWTPVVPTDTTLVAEKTYNAQYTKSIAEQVTENGGIEGKDLAAWVGDNLDSDFWKKGVVAKSTITDAAKKAAVEAAIQAAKKVEDTTQPARTTANEVLNPTDGTLKITFADDSSLTVTQKLYVYKNGSTNPTNPDQPKPTDSVVVTYKAGTGVSSFADKEVLVKKGTLETALPEKPNATVDTAAGYKGSVIWTADPAIDATNGIQKDTKVTATALKKTTAETVTENGGIEGKDLAAWVGDNLDSDFWKKGVVAKSTITDAAKKAAVEAAIQAAKKVEDTTQPARTTANEVLNPTDGTLKITFADDSTLEVTQKLYVYKNGSNKPTNPDQPTPTDSVVVTYKAGTGVQNFADKEVLVKKGTLETALPEKPNAKVDTANGYKGSVIWTADPAIDATNGIQKDTKVTATATKSTKPAAPTVDDITEGDDSIKVKTPTDGDTVIVTIPDPTPSDPNKTKEIEVKKDGNKWKTGNTDINEKNGKLIIPVKPEDITKDKEIKVTVKDLTRTTDNVSDPTIKKVKGKGTPTPTYNYITLTLDENYRGGRISDYDVIEGDLIERYLYTPRRRGYVFEGWSYNSRRLDEVKPGDRIYYPTILYAIWSNDRDYGRRYDRDKREEEPEVVDTRLVHDHKAYMFGYTDGTVRPNGKITRAEAAALVTRLLGLDTFASAAKPMFSDTPSSWYNKAINAAVDRGIMKGYPDGRFRPNAPITRAEFTQMISTIDNKPYGVAPFADVKGHWAERPIGSEYQAGRIKGYPDGTFRPNAFITRCEAVVILNKIFERNFDAMSLKDAKNAYLIKGFIDLPTSFWGYYDMIEATNTHSFKRRVEGKVQEDWTLVK